MSSTRSLAAAPSAATAARLPAAARYSCSFGVPFFAQSAKNGTPLRGKYRSCEHAEVWLLDHWQAHVDAINAGGPTAITTINGAVVREGQRLGVPTPVNRLLTALVAALDDTAVARVRE